MIVIMNDRKGVLLCSNINPHGLYVPNRFHLKGPHARKLETFAENLPGLPFKITRSPRNGYWVGFYWSRLTGGFDGFYYDHITRTLVFNVSRFIFTISDFL